MNGEVQVRIRHAEQVRAVPLTTWPVAELESLVRQVRYWGVYEGGGSGEVTGQWVIGDDDAHFEIVVEAE